MFLDSHSRKRHYMFQLKKCTSETCAYCVLNPPRLPEELFENLHFVPDPVVLNDQFRSFEDIYGTETDDSLRSSIQNVPETSERDKQFKNLLVQTKVRGYISCKECGKRRCTYSGKKLSAADERSILRLDEELIYTCGEPLFRAGRLKDVIIVKEGISCNTPIEAAYYAGKTMQFQDICFHCGDISVTENEDIQRLKEQYGIVRPICQSCLTGGKAIKTRMALKTNKKQKK